MPNWRNGRWTLQGTDALLWDGVPVQSFPSKACHLLARLISHPSRVVPYADVVKGIWGPPEGILEWNSASPEAESLRTARALIRETFCGRGDVDPIDKVRGVGLFLSSRWEPIGEGFLSTVLDDSIWSVLQDWLVRVGGYEVPPNVQALISSGRLGFPKLAVADATLDDSWDLRVEVDQVDFEQTWSFDRLIELMPEATKSALVASRERGFSSGRYARNNSKVFFTRYDWPVIDQGSRPKFHGGLYDFSWSDSLHACAMDIQSAILRSGLSVEHVPKRFDNQIVAVTLDNRLLLGLRSGAVSLANLWQVSLGEGYAPDELGVDQISTKDFVLRTLSYADEVNIRPERLTRARVAVLGVATEWDSLMGNLLCYVRLPVTFEEVHRNFDRGEFSEIDGIEFNLKNCIDLVARGWHLSVKHPERRGFVPCSVMNLLLALRAEFGSSQLMKALTA